jgi:hypothetical protein
MPRPNTLVKGVLNQFVPVAGRAHRDDVCIEHHERQPAKFYDWRERYGKVNEHNGWVPRDFWLEEWEKQAIIGSRRAPPSAQPEPRPWSGSS